MSERDREGSEAPADSAASDNRATQGEAGGEGERPGQDWPREIGGQRGPEPTRYGDWESNGRCTDF